MMSGTFWEIKCTTFEAVFLSLCLYLDSVCFRWFVLGAAT